MCRTSTARRAKLNQVFTNLITNAAQAIEQKDQGRGTLKLDHAAVTPDWVEVIVEDDGCGIAEEHLMQDHRSLLHHEAGG